MKIGHVTNTMSGLWKKKIEVGEGSVRERLDLTPGLFLLLEGHLSINR